MPGCKHEGPSAGIVAASLLFSAFLNLCPPGAVAADERPNRIVVNVPARTLSLYAGESLVRRYPVAVGGPATPTALGAYRIKVKVVNPTWYPKNRPPVPPGPQNPVGTRWLGLDLPEVGLHGTNNPSSIGQAVSNGCIRLRNADVEELFWLVTVGTPVEFIYQMAELSVLPPGDSPDPGESLWYTYGLTVHPDLYRRGAATVEQVVETLRAAGITAELDHARLERLVREARGILEPLPVVPRVVVQGRPARRVRVDEGRTWLALSEAAELAGEPLFGWEMEERMIDGEAWVDAAEFARRKGYRVEAKASAAALYLTAPLVFCEGNPVTRAFCRSDGGELVPLEALARACGRTLAVDECFGLAVGEGGRTATVVFHGEEACLDPVRAADLLGLDVSTNAEGIWFTLEQPGE